MNSKTQVQDGIDVVQRAVELAVKHHAKQVRENRFPMPYVVHPMDVLHLLGVWGANHVDVSCAAICHDLLEDTKCEEAEITDAIGPEATSIVKELTFLPPVGVKGHDFNLAKDEYLRSFATKSVKSLVVKVADRICNTNDFISDVPDGRTYAPKYWAKADDLFYVFYERLEEVISVFGSTTMQLIDLNIKAVNNRLNKIVFPFYD